MLADLILPRRRPASDCGLVCRARCPMLRAPRQERRTLLQAGNPDEAQAAPCEFLLHQCSGPGRVLPVRSGPYAGAVAERGARHLARLWRPCRLSGDGTTQFHLAERDLGVGFGPDRPSTRWIAGTSLWTNDIAAFKKPRREGIPYSDYGSWAMNGWHGSSSTIPTAMSSGPPGQRMNRSGDADRVSRRRQYGPADGRQAPRRRT